MTAPTVTSIDPVRGHTIGETFVKITGTDFNLPSIGDIKVLFGTKEAKEVGVVSPTLIICLTPGGDVDEIVDVTVENSTEPGPVLESDTLASAFTYKRPSIATPSDLSNHSAVALVSRKLVEDIRRTVIEEVHHDMHPEYTDAVSAAVPQEKQASPINLKILGPIVEEDRFYSFNDRQVLEPVGDVFDITDNIVAAKLTYNFVGIARSSSEATNLWVSLLRYFNKTPLLQVFRNGVDDTLGIVEFEMLPLWEQRGEFATIANREGVFQFQGSFEIRGVPVLVDLIGQTHRVLEDVILEIEQLP